jgi:uncharacterized protein YigE (DUF2233 family)
MTARSTLTLLALFLVCKAVAAPETKTVDGVDYHILYAPVTSVKIIWKDNNGTPLRTFPAVAEYLKSESLQVDTLMNGGIFEPGGIPSGLLIQNGKVLNPVNRDRGAGNFYLQPNGIFLVGSAGAAVIRADEYPLKDITIQQAVQSGPLLLRQGKVHPAFNANSMSRLHRNGVGVAKNGEVVFAMTDFNSPKFPNLYEFAQLFRTLGCDDALFLDGDISQMSSGAGLNKASNAFGSIIAVTESPKVEQPADGKAPKAPQPPR